MRLSYGAGKNFKLSRVKLNKLKIHFIAISLMNHHGCYSLIFFSTHHCHFKNLLTFASAKQKPRIVQPLNRGNYVGTQFTYPQITATVSILTGTVRLLLIKKASFKF
jgi:hypothetical protein